MSHSDTEDQVTETEVTETEVTGAEVTEAIDPIVDATTEPVIAPISEADQAEIDEAEEPAGDDSHVVADDPDDAATGEGADEGDEDEPDRLELEGDVAADYLEELLDIADLDGDLDMDVEGDRAVVSIVGADLNQLVGARGEVLEALQELTRLAVYRETGERSRLMLDISGHRARRREQLVELANETSARVKETGESVSLKAMSPFERKVVHDAVAAAGLVSESEGVEPRRFVVVLPK